MEERNPMAPVFYTPDGNGSGPMIEQQNSRHGNQGIANQKSVSENENLGRASMRALHDFGSTTSAHGWGRFTLATNRKVKVLWLVLTLTALFVNILHVTMLVKQYLNFPMEQVSQVHVADIEFPSVTVCNIQPFSMTTALAMRANTSTRAFYWDNITRTHFKESPGPSMTSDLSYDLLYNRVRQPIGFFENIGDEVKDIGHQPWDMVLSCRFGIERCSHHNLTRFQSPQYYNCYTFNGGNTSKDNLIVKTTGPQAGLSLIMYLESDNGDFMYNGTYYTFGNVVNAAGVRVQIHPPNTKPSPMDHGFDIPPGYSSSVGVNAVKHERLGEPYSECRESTDWELGNGQYVYSSHACLMQCQQTHIMDLCDCISADLPIPPAAQARNLNYCGHFNPEYPQTFFDNLSCEIDIAQQFMQREDVQEACQCLSPCSEYVYDTKISFSAWPMDLTQESFFTTYVMNHPEAHRLKAKENLSNFNLTELIFYGFIRKNFLRLNVYLESLVVLEYIERGSYTFYSLWSDIGGSFGLWIGMSFLTWCEVIELILKLIYNAVVLPMKH